PVIEAQRADGEVKAQANAPVVTQVAEIVSIGFQLDIANIIKQRKAQALDNRDRIFGITKPIGITADRLADAGFARADAAIFEAAQRIKPAQIIALIEGDVRSAIKSLGNARPGADFKDVPRSEPFNIPGAA